MVTTRHEFLAALHRELRPDVYLEIGVQHGWSLALANTGCRATGIDPHPQLLVDVHGATVHAERSDAFFARPDTDPHLRAAVDGGVDLAFIDGMHLYEYALRDFINVERWASPRGVVVLDDVLPRNQREASRTQCPGDWTGDVWRVEPILRAWRPDLRIALVDTQPTGLLIVWGLDPDSRVLSVEYDEILRHWPLEDADVPPWALDRKHAVTPGDALDEINAWRVAL